ncbi:MAG: serine/threonine-protein phosphatase [bacterium]|nr:serine/threonine-protein phosphatase [bacterium]
MTTKKQELPYEPDVLRREIEAFVDGIAKIRPHHPVVRVGNVEIAGETRFLQKVAGGDHIVYVDFNRRYDLERRQQKAARQGRQVVVDALERNRKKVGILLADVSGHGITDALVAAMLHQAFLTGVLYELGQFGQVTTRLFENLNTRFYKSLSVEKYVTLIYGEVNADGCFHFLSAGHPPPMVFSSEHNCFVTIHEDRLLSCYPLGVFPSQEDIDASRNMGALRYKPSYSVNEVNLLGVGDILLLATDGVAEHEKAGERFADCALEDCLRELKDATAAEICSGLLDRAVSFAPPDDDMSLVVIKRAE